MREGHTATDEPRHGVDLGDAVAMEVFIGVGPAATT